MGLCLSTNNKKEECVTIEQTIEPQEEMKEPILHSKIL